MTCWLVSRAVSSGTADFVAARSSGARHGKAVADDDAQRVAAGQPVEHLRARGVAHALEVAQLARAEHLHDERVDEVQVPDEPQPGAREHLVGELAVAPRGARGPGEAQALAPVLKELLNAEAGHTATIP